jgi:triacylglycerol esterase/lipase EstA (alpha/beta hydrolase family)
MSVASAVRTSLSALAVLAWINAAPDAARAADFAPPDTPGPALSVPQGDLDAALTCSASGVDAATRAPVLLVQGTGATAKDNWSWTYEPALDQLGIGWCAVDLPDHATGDVQRNGEYVVNAIRTMHARAGRPIAIIGHSQGGMVPRWALRFWPDTRAMVDDLIGFAPSNHGTTQASAVCRDGCSAADWQQSDSSQFMKALNSSAETWSGVSYTNVYTRTDEVVQPNLDDHGSSSLHTGDGRITNVATQDVCPANVYEHLSIGLVDPVAYALAVDALGHDGPAEPARIDPLTCAQILQPGVNKATVARDAAAATADYAGYQAKDVPEEPPLACYTTASCPPAAPAPAAPAATTGASRACVTSRRFTVRLPRLRGARATLAGKRVKLRRSGRRLVATVQVPRRSTRTVVLRLRGRDARGHRVTVTRRYRACG